MKALTVVLQTFNVCSYMAWILDTMTLDLSDIGLWWWEYVQIDWKAKQNHWINGIFSLFGLEPMHCDALLLSYSGFFNCQGNIWIFCFIYTFAKLMICTLECGELIIRSKIIFNWLNPEGNMHKLIIDNICEL